MIQFQNVEKRMHDMIIIPSFQLTMKATEVHAIYSNVNIREQLIALLSLQSYPSQGEILLTEVPLTKKNKHEIQFFSIHDLLYEKLTVKEMLQFINRMQTNESDIASIISFVSLDEKIHTRIEDLTYSERKRVQLACFMLQEAQVYLLEEPDQNIDLESKQILHKVIQQLKERGKTVCILTMNMESALNLADVVYRMDEAGLHKVEIIDEDVVDEQSEVIQPVKIEKIPSKIDDKIVLFDPFEIDYIESHEGISYLFIKGDKFPSTTTLNELEKKLLPFGFFRCHRSYIVNLQKVREVITWTRNSYSLILDDKKKTTIPLSKAQMTTLKDMLDM